MNEVLKPSHVGMYVNLDDGGLTIPVKILSVSRTKFTYEIVCKIPLSPHRKGSQGTGERTPSKATFFKTADEVIKEAKWIENRLAAYKIMMQGNEKK
jgi:hypothetical protein